MYNIYDSQDCKQKWFGFYKCITELYSIVIGTCLITFVPHTCGNVNCGYTQVYGKNIFDIAFYMNIVTLGCFLILYMVELIRENKLINYLEVNILLANDNESVGNIIKKLNPMKRKRLYWIDTIYVSWAGFCICCFGTNTLFSGIVILHSINNKTITVFVTNLLFILTKIYRVFYVINTQKNIYYSAYLTNFVQFNDLDPREIEWIDVEENWISITIDNEQKD